MQIYHNFKPHRRKIVEFLHNHDEVFVLEELDDLVESEIKRIAFEEGVKVKIFGKPDAEAWIGEYSADKVASLSIKPGLVSLPSHQIKNTCEIPARPARMCPGCGLRSVFFAVKQALEDVDIKVADIGCHTLGFMPPYSNCCRRLFPCTEKPAASFCGIIL